MAVAKSTAEVVVVGAGMAGLTTALMLTRSDVDVIVLEARDRIGGRIHSRIVDDGAVDLGATWFWQNESELHALVRDYGLQSFLQADSGDMLYIQRGPRTHRLPGSTMSSESNRFAGGAQALPTAIASDLPAGSVHLNSPVHKIEMGPTSVTVHANDQLFTANQAIVAMPPPLAIEQITFVPPLPEQLAAVASQTAVWMGGMIKAIAIYERPFWRDQGFSGLVLSEIGPFRELHDHSAQDDNLHAIFGFAPAELMVGVDDARIQDALVTQLVDIYGSDAANPAQVFSTNWLEERFTSPRTQATSSTATYGHPVFMNMTPDSRLHWASTETADAFGGHMEGAIRAGKRAARTVLSLSNFRTI